MYNIKIDNPKELSKNSRFLIVKYLKTKKNMCLRESKDLIDSSDAIYFSLENFWEFVKMIRFLKNNLQIDEIFEVTCSDKFCGKKEDYETVRIALG